MHMERANWANCLPLYFYICIDIYDTKQMEGSAERAVRLFYLSVSVNPLLTFLLAVRVQGPSLLMQGQSGLSHTAAAECQHHIHGEHALFCVWFQFGTCVMLLSVQFLLHVPSFSKGYMLQTQGAADCRQDRGFSSLIMMSKSKTLASSLAA